ncbi:MAG TPA: amidohydrolase family protein [Casimicrobiaceae bacterium]|nr:amidohydrolase family protein [Casimicrobiaceae bacterium]
MHGDRVDVHHHLFPPPFVAQLVDHEHYLSRGVARHWTPRASIEDMDAAGIATAFTSITAPGLAFTARERMFAVNRECNEFGARMMADHGERFGLFASLPLPDVESSLGEIEYALDTLRADGIGLLTSYAGRWLGDGAFAPVMDELNRRRAVVYVHPTVADCCRNLLPGIADWVLEFPVDTTRTIASLLFGGTLTRCPDIRFIFAHVGGILPLVVEHLERAAQVDPTLTAMAPDGVRTHLRRLHYDTALRMHAVGISSALGFADASQLLLGTDAPLRKSADQLAELHALGLPDEVLAKIESQNARRLLGRYRSFTRKS